MIMYEKIDIDVIELELTNKCNATCPMCARTINGKTRKNMELIELDIKFLKNIDIEIIKKLKKIEIKGGYGEGILHSEFLKIIKYFININPCIFIEIHTNGSLKTKNFWKQLAVLFTTYNIKHDVIFSIDGLEDTNHLYRKGTIWNKIIDNAKEFINNGGYASWFYLIFKHNEHQIDLAEQLSKQLGFKQFVTKVSSRFNDTKFLVEDDKKESYYIYKSEKYKINNIFEHGSNINKENYNKIDKKIINCKSIKNYSKIKYSKIYIDVYGIVTPCCWIGAITNPFNNTFSNKNFFEYISKEDFDNCNILNYKLTKILKNNMFTNIMKSWINNDILTCVKHCGYGTFEKEIKINDK